MTVGIAALAEGGRAIVCMADKQLTGGEGLKFEQEAAKVIELPNGWLVLYAGDATFAEAVVAHAGTAYNEIAESKRPRGQIGMLKLLHNAYADQFDDFAIRNVVRPRIVDEDTWRHKRGTLDEATRDALDTEIEAYGEKEGAELIGCGFFREKGIVLKIGWKLQARELGFATIGTGGAIAEYRLAWHKTRQSDPLARILYEVYEAKAHSELDAFVGANVDAWVMLGNGVGVLVPPRIMRLLDRVFRYNDQTPFSVRRQGERRYAAPPADWQQRLDRYIATMLRPFSSARGRPSSQSRSGGTRSASPPEPSRPLTRRGDRAPRRPGSSPRSRTGRSMRQAR